MSGGSLVGGLLPGAAVGARWAAFLPAHLAAFLLAYLAQPGAAWQRLPSGGNAGRHGVAGSGRADGHPRPDCVPDMSAPPLDPAAEPAPAGAPPAGRPRLRVAQEVGAEAVEVLRRRLVRRAARLIRTDPEAAQLAAEMGLVDPRWLDDPTTRPITPATPVEMLQRFLERSVDARPSRLRTIGYGALGLLASGGAPDRVGNEAVTVVFTDLEGFTRYTDTYGDVSALELLQAHNQAAGAVVRRWQGRIVKRLGDGLLCVFGEPETGVRAAVELLGTAPAPLVLRAGVHTGEALLSKSDVIGQVVNVAARVAEGTAGGQVSITGDVLALAGALPGLRVDDGRTEVLRGVSTPVVIHRVTT
jgi:class 3 adenylate cyclase